MTQQEFQQRYNAAERLGEGGFGEVFKAYDKVRDRWVALKVSKVKTGLESIRLRNEVELINQLPEHPNIAFYEGCFTFQEMSGEYDYGILQYYEEGNLLQLLRNTQTLSGLEQKTAILTQILDGLEFLHGHGIIHRDLKPQNILIVRRQNGELVPKITDFGISKKFDANHSSVFINSLAGAGTLAYSSPEQLADREIRKNTDLWGFGVIAFQVLTGQLPFTTGDHASTSEAGRYELFSQINSGSLPDCINRIAEPWQTLIRQCLITDPSKRIKNVQEAKALLAGGHGRDFGSNVSKKTDDHTKIDRPKSSEPSKPFNSVKSPEYITSDAQPSHPKPSPNLPPQQPRHSKKRGKYLLLTFIGLIGYIGLIVLLVWFRLYILLFIILGLIILLEGIGLLFGLYQLLRGSGSEHKLRKILLSTFIGLIGLIILLWGVKWLLTLLSMFQGVDYLLVITIFTLQLVGIGLLYGLYKLLRGSGSEHKMSKLLLSTFIGLIGLNVLLVSTVLTILILE